jgi:hypothetical protein
MSHSVKELHSTKQALQATKQALQAAHPGSDAARWFASRGLNWHEKRIASDDRRPLNDEIGPDGKAER